MEFNTYKRFKIHSKRMAAHGRSAGPAIDSRKIFSLDDVEMLLNEGYKVAREIVIPSSFQETKLALSSKAAR